MALYGPILEVLGPIWPYMALYGPMLEAVWPYMALYTGSWVLAASRPRTLALPTSGVADVPGHLVGGARVRWRPRGLPVPGRVLGTSWRPPGYL